jgi:hypothetical protein
MHPVSSSQASWVVAIYVLGATLSAGVATQSHAYRSGPTAPPCATRYGQFDDQDDFDSCKLQMSSYRCQARHNINQSGGCLSDFEVTFHSVDRTLAGFMEVGDVTMNRLPPQMPSIGSFRATISLRPPSY